MPIKIPPVIVSQDAGDTDYDNSTSGLTAADVQAAIDELAAGGGKTASPGFTFGRSGNVGAGTYLLNESVPSNIAGRRNYLIGSKITNISISNDGANTFDVTVEEHDGVTYTTLTTVSVVAARSANFTVSVSATTGKEISTKISSGSAKNPLVTVQMRGTTS